LLVSFTAKPEGDTIFEEPYVEKETFGIFNNFDIWSRLKNNQIHQTFTSDQYFPNQQTYVFDWHIAKFLAPWFDGYMGGPTALYEGNTLLAKTRHVETLEELLELEKVIKDIPNKKFLYTVDYVSLRYEIISIDDVGNVKLLAKRGLVFLVGAFAMEC
jgi:hypothetical protein